MAKTLHDTLCDHAYAIQRNEAYALTGLGLREETLTDLVVNAIAAGHSDFVYTKKFTHKEESSVSGADWLWCVGEPGAWISFAVQAKIESRKTRRINYLHYREGQQYNRLVNFCKIFGIIPKYSLFSAIEQDEVIGEGCLRTIEPVQWAFSAIAPKHVSHLRTAKERCVSRVRPYSLPWSYIFSQQADSVQPLAKGIARISPEYTGPWRIVIV